jgi:precorrin-2 dehydrogenase / sirohydrochlorin ferrochelatase
MSNTNFSSQNELYPIFLKLEILNVLIIGGGFVGTEKLHFMMKNSPNANVTLVAIEIAEEIKQIASNHSTVTLIKRAFVEQDLNNLDLVIIATDNKELNKQIYHLAKAKKILANVADTPDYCDFYLGSIVTKGDLKVAISTNGKSPTFAKRFREVLEEVLPDDLPQLLLNLKKIRNELKTGFAEKVKQLNELTSTLVNGNHSKD